MPNKNKVLLVDDHPLVREWLADLINLESDLEVCGQAGSVREAMRLVERTLPAIAIVDISLDGGSGLELIKDIRATHPQVVTIILSMHDEMLYAERAMRAGANGYVMKREATGKVLEAIRTVLAGKLFYSSAVTSSMAQKLARGATPATAGSPIHSLSDRELEVFELLGRGCSTRQISDQLNLSFKTIQVYCSRIKEKLNLVNVNELIAHAARWNERRPAG
jgi:DNA-binding NarL/FixJ family response regulator